MSLRGVVANVLDCDIVVSEFELQVFRFNTLGKGMNPTYCSSYGLNSTITIFLLDESPWCSGKHTRLWHRS